MTSNPPDYALAMQYNQSGYNLDHAEGAANIGMLYENGWGVEKNAATATTWYQRACDMKSYRSAQADFQLGGLYERGLGVNRDLTLAKAHYTEALKIATSFKHYEDLAQPSRDALNRLATLVTPPVQQNTGTALQPAAADVTQDQRKAHFVAIRAAIPDFDQIVESGAIQDWVKKQPSSVRGPATAILEHGTAQEVIGLFQTFKASKKSKPPVQQNTDTAPPSVATTISAAAQGDAIAQYNLGVKYDKGEGVPKDTAKAAEWYQKAALQGYAIAQFNLGAMYRDGDGVQKDAAKAVEWWQKAAAQGVARAQFFLGTMYDRGEGVSKNSVKAVEWWQKAAAQGDANAQQSLGEKYNKGESAPKGAANQERERGISPPITEEQKLENNKEWLENEKDAWRTRPF